MATKHDIFKRYLNEYLQADRARKSEILDHATDVVRMHRKSAIRRFRRLQMRDPGSYERRGRRTTYTKDVDAALHTIWQAANEPCGELLHAVVKEYVAILKRDGMWKHDAGATTKLLRMGEHTVRRRVSAFIRSRPTAKGLSSTKPSQLKSIIPIFKGPWRNVPPGTGQLDTMAHCGDTLLGDFVYTVTYTDAPTYWVVSQAQWNKSQEATVSSMAAIKGRLPVRWKGAHPDTGSEFINWVAKRWCDGHGIALTRSEPGKKNDNMYVEERNGHVVRKYLGYTRFDCQELVPLINRLYDALGLYLNHFQAVRRTLAKERIGARYRRLYEREPKTPYRRMLEHPDVAEEVKAHLRNEHASLNPLLLKREIDTLMITILKKQRSHGTKK